MTETELVLHGKKYWLTPMCDSNVAIRVGKGDRMTKVGRIAIIKAKLRNKSLPPRYEIATLDRRTKAYRIIARIEVTDDS